MGGRGRQWTVHVIGGLLSILTLAIWRQLLPFPTMEITLATYTDFLIRHNGSQCQQWRSIKAYKAVSPLAGTNRCANCSKTQRNSKAYSQAHTHVSNDYHLRSLAACMRAAGVYLARWAESMAHSHPQPNMHGTPHTSCPGAGPLKCYPTNHVHPE